MMTEDKSQLVSLGLRLAETGKEVQKAQDLLEKMVEEYGMFSDQAVEAAQAHSALCLRFSGLEEEYLALRAHILIGK